MHKRSHEEASGIAPHERSVVVEEDRLGAHCNMPFSAGFVERVAKKRVM